MVTLAAMTEQQYLQWLTQAIEAYAGDKTEAGNWSAAEALEQSRATYQRLLPAGTATPDQHLFTILAEVAAGSGPQPVGMIWFGVVRAGPEPYAFIYDFRIDEAYRRRGFGRAALQAVEAEVRGLGLDRIGLHVFGHNTAALKLYEAAGYQVTNISLMKKV